MCHQAAIRSLVSIFVLLGITLFSVSSQAANCHESIQKTIDSDSIEHTVQYHISNKDFADISKCCEGNHLGTCCKICHSKLDRWITDYNKCDIVDIEPVNYKSKIKWIDHKINTTWSCF